MKKSLLLLTLVLFVMTTKAANIEYSISFTEAKGHYVDVLMNIKANKGKKVELKLPTWAPGSYLIREFSRHVEEVKATANNASLKVTKKDKNTWVVDNPNGADITVQYRVYAFELTVRTSFVDDSHAYLNGSNVFMYVEGRSDEKASVKVNPLPSWKKISCALPSNSKNEFIAENYDLLADSPFEIGNQDLIEFTAQGIPHTVAMVGGGNYDAEKIKTDFTKIINEATSIFGTHPCKNYLFIVHNVPSGGGGLEHLNSTTVQVNRFAYSNEATYRSFLGLIAHEYFHLWNVKRLRPVALGPFNYNEENYTRMLWVA
jgi:predicted metalloprotease with PDZ domain